MKKLIVFILTILIVHSSCNKEEDLYSTNNFREEVEFMTDMNTTALNLAVLNFKKNSSQIEDAGINLNLRLLIEDVLMGLNGQFFEVDEEIIRELSSEYGELRLPNELLTIRVSEDIDLASFNFFSSEQIAIAQPFVDELLSTENYEKSKERAISFQHTVVNSSLSDDEKFQLLSLSSGVLGFAEFLKDGGIEKISDVLSTKLKNSSKFNGRVMGCSVDWRGVWAGAVVGFMAGGASGAYIGCTGGTVALPGIGTVGGCVGGAVFGATGGFVGGAISGIATNLLITCFR